VEIAVAQAGAVRHRREAAQQAPSARLVKQLRARNVVRQPRLEAAEAGYGMAVKP
jgi:hypothetical protein